MGLFGKKKPAKELAALEGDGFYSYDGVVGESFHREELLSLIRQAPESERQEGEIRTTATVLADPKNEYDRNAVAVHIGGLLVGHIARDDTPLFHAAFRTVADAGFRSDGFLCHAVIGWSGIPTDSPIGVRLDLTFHDE